MKTIIRNYTIAYLITQFSWATILNVPDDYPTIQAGIDASFEGDTDLPPKSCTKC